MEILADLGITGFLLYYIPFILAAMKCGIKQHVTPERRRLALTLLVCISLEDITGVSYYLVFQKLIFIADILLLQTDYSLNKREDEVIGTVWQ